MSIAGVVATAILGLCAASASAGDVWLWACHGPAGQPIPTSPNDNKVETLATSSTADGVTGDVAHCWTPGGAVALAVPAATPAAGSASTLTITMPSGVNATMAKVNYAVTSGTGQLSLAGQNVPASGAEFPVPSSNTATLKLSCTSSCAVDVTSVALRVTDDADPSAGVAWNTPVDKEMVVTPSATDGGVGLDRAEITVGGITKSADFGDCDELSPAPADTTNDRPLHTARCLRGESGGVDKPLKMLAAPIVVWRDNPVTGALDPLRLPEGNFTRTITVYDVAGNTDVINGQVEVWHPPAPVSQRTLNISTSSVNEQPNTPGGNNPPGGGVQGGQATQCRAPRLSVVLDSKPVRVSKGTPVLKYKKAYRFTGRLTCVINGKRRSAPKRTKITVLNKVGKKTVRKPNTSIRDKGGVNVKLAFVSSRTVIFRYSNAAGQKSEVKIKVRVTKKKK